MGAKLSYDFKNKTLICPWHGLEFNTDTCKSNNNKFPLISKKNFTVEDNFIVLK